MNPITLNFGLRSAPELADHGFQGLTVLPGAWLVAAAREHAPNRHAALRAVRFERPLILGEDDQAVRLDIVPTSEGAACVFASGESVLARMQLAPPAPHPDAPARVFAAPGAAPGAEPMYGRLEANGNRYGPHFRRLRWVTLSGQRATAALALGPARGEFDPLWIDAGVQLVAALAAERGRTFVLAGIDEVSLPVLAGPPVHAEATLTAETRADATLYDREGRPSVILKGISFSLLDPGSPPLPLVISATFTAEPVEDGLRFWSDRIGLPIEARFAPYNQVFQELLAADSASRRNRTGTNVLLVHLADWLPPAPGRSPEAGAEPWPAGVACHDLPNGMRVAHLNRHETDYVYQEIFSDRCYLRHGVTLPPQAVVIDIGANIGLFSLFVRAERPDARVFAFEPSPVAFRALEANCRAYGPGLHPCNAGVGRESGEAVLTFYARSSVFSSFHPNLEEDRGAVQAVVENMVRSELGPDAGPVDEYVRDLTADRLGAQTFTCPMVSVSDIVRQHRLGRIDLLKVDAEKCELDILRGIDDAHWPLIRQVVVEVHDRTRAALAEAQAILGARGFRCACEEERLLAGSGLFNVYAVRDDAHRSRPDADHAAAGGRWLELQAKAEEFERALSAYAGAGAPPAILAFCPPSPHGLSRQEEWQLGVIEERLAAHARALPALTVIDSSALRARNPGTGWHLGPAEAAGHIPFTAEGFALLATAVMRAIAALRRPPFKAVAVDCDHTLWQGVCAEDGPLGVAVTPAHRAIQEFLLRQVQAGMMLCLCSKNEEADVWAVFERNPGMVLRREHVAAARIGWEPKSEGLQTLARALNIGIESFLFLDDNPLEIAEVRERCPGALALALADPIADAPRRLEHCWAFDHPRVTAEDQARLRMLREAAGRERFRESAATLADFIAGLGLQVAVAPPQPEELGRLAQLTQRTNQFNFTSRRRSEFELRRHLQEEGGRALAVAVRDRFGDYGCVGLVLYQLAGTRCAVDTFLLSCRVLGRGVEHQVLAALAEEAVRGGAATVELPLRPTARNRPAADFVRALHPQSQRTDGDATVFGFAAKSLRALRYDPDARPAASEPNPADSSPRPPPQPAFGLGAEAHAAIAELGADAARLSGAIECHRLRSAGAEGAGQPPDAGATVAERLLALWRRILANPRVGLDQNFFDAGGTSLKAVQAVAAIRRELRLPATVTLFFECPTVRRLSEKLDPAGAPAAPPAGDALERGARRRARLRRTAA